MEHHAMPLHAASGREEAETIHVSQHGSVAPPPCATGDLDPAS